MRSQKLLAFIILLMIGNSFAGSAAVRICQGGCSALVGSCYTAGGYTFGTVTGGSGAPGVVLGCNSGYSACMKSCNAAYLWPFW